MCKCEMKLVRRCDDADNFPYTVIVPAIWTPEAIERIKANFDNPVRVADCAQPKRGFTRLNRGEIGGGKA